MIDPVPDKLREHISSLQREIEPARDLWPEIRSEVERVSGRSPNTLLRFAFPLAAAACVAIAVLLLWPRSAPAGPGWKVVSLAGSPLIGDVPITGVGRWQEGDWLETDEHSRAQLEVGLIGEVQLEPGSRLRLANASEKNHRLELARGTMSALIWAPPRLFFVETPSAIAVDLGCAYTLTVDDAGAGLLHVTSGYVALELADRESIVPSGMMCVTRPGAGPGTPFAANAPAELRAALDRFDAGGGDQAAALDTVLANSSAADQVMLWHLLASASGAQRGGVFDRLAQFAPPPEGVTREGLIAGDIAMRDRWALELGLVLSRRTPAKTPRT
jgi:hypothetical protein